MVLVYINSIIYLEYTQQLPVDGGVYFHPDLMESSRIIYKEHWIIIMHAFSIWIKNLNKEIENWNEALDINKENNLIITILGSFEI